MLSKNLACMAIFLALLTVALASAGYSCSNPFNNIEGISVPEDSTPVEQTIRKESNIKDVKGPFCVVSCSNGVWSVKISTEKHQSCLKAFPAEPICKCENLDQDLIHAGYKILSGYVRGSQLKQLCQME